MPKKFWMCFVEGRGVPREQHLTYQEAEQEAERLAKLQDNLGLKVFVLETIAYCQVKVVPVTWLTLFVEEEAKDA